MSDQVPNNEVDSLLTEEERNKISFKYIALESALADYIKDFEKRIPVENFKNLATPVIKDLVMNKFEPGFKILGNDLCEKLCTIKDKLKEFENELLKALSDLREVCQCGL